jgi:phenylpyruvate tautomerase PptA (4-oxalocrotonate tautomerase family)
MPIVDVTIVAGRDEKVTTGLTQALADGIGRVLNSPSGQTWVRLHPLTQDRYAENNTSLTSTDLPVFVSVLTREIPDQSQLVGTIAKLTRAISEVTGRPSDKVHIEYAPSAVGRVAFGGKLVE